MPSRATTSTTREVAGRRAAEARLARSRGIPVIYYICPQIWAWAPWRRPKVLRLTDLLMVILPFEVELYRNPRVPAAYVGHPLADELLWRKAGAEADLVRSSLGVPSGGKVVGIFPGSRAQEVTSLMPLIRDILEGAGLEPGRDRILASACRPEFRPIIEDGLRGLSTPAVIDAGDSRPLMAACDFALAASGTATLELAFYGKPMLVLYRIAAWQMVMYRLFAVSPFISLVNLLARREVVPERVVVRPRAGEMSAVARSLLRDTPEREACIRRLDELRRSAFSPGGVERAARTLIEFLERREA